MLLGIGRFIFSNPDAAIYDSDGKLFPVVQKRVDELSEEVDRVQQYEQELHERSTFLDEILHNASELDYTLTEKPAQHSKIDADDIDNGVGGADEKLDSSMLGAATSAIAALNVPNSNDWLKMLDAELDSARRIPLGIPVQGKITSGFGRRISPFSGSLRGHTGVDIAVERETPVMATAEGTVIKARYMGAYGNTVIVEHGKGVVTRYSHLTKALVKPGDKVCRGQEIGRVGSTGRATGPHLHYEVRINGRPRNPMSFIQASTFLREIS